MNKNKAVELEVIRRVHFGGYSIEVGESADAPELVCIRTTNKESQDYFGKFDIPMDAAVAFHLGHALLAAAKEKGSS